MKVATAYTIIKELPLTPIQLVQLYELMGNDVRSITMPSAEDAHNEEIEIEKRLIANRTLVLPYGRQNNQSPR